MKISNINNNLNSYKSPSFGYDKKANDELRLKLINYRDNEDKEWGNTLLNLQWHCNTLEDSIRICEKKMVKDEKLSHKFHDYVDIFLSSKEALCAYVVDTFPETDFSDKEFLHYQHQLAIKKYPKEDWRKSVCEKIQDWCQQTRNINQFYGKTLKDPEPVDVEPSNKETESKNNAQKPQGTSEKPETTDDTSVDKPSTQSQLDKTNPKSFLEIFHNGPNTPKGFCDVAGMAQLKQELSDGIIQYIINPEQAQLDFEEYGKTMPKAILLYGPPGCGKTYITQALSQEVQTPLYMLNISKAGSHYINLTSKNIKEAFEQVTELSKKSDKPIMLFMDEIDTMAFDRSSRTENEDLKQVGTLLQEIDKVKNANVILIGATNKVNLLDPAIRRRFDMKTLVDIPDVESIQALVKKNLSSYKKGQQLMHSDEEILEIAKLLKGFSNSSICNISKQAALNALNRDRADIAFEDFEKAIKETTEEKPDRTDYLSENAGNRKLGF